MEDVLKITCNDPNICDFKGGKCTNPNVPDIPDSNIPQAIEKLSSFVPRFLFRAWWPQSGGYYGLNTSSRIVPRASRHGKGPATIHDIPKEVLVATVQKHLDEDTSAEFETCFSSWTQSLETAIEICRQKGTESYISILDTKLLSPHNVVLYTPTMQFISREISCLHGETFFIFGPLSGSAFKAVSFARLVNAGSSSTDVLQASAATYEERLTRAHGMGSLFGDHFALPMTIFIMTLDEDVTDADAEEMMLNKLSGWSIPRDWCDNEHLRIHPNTMFPAQETTNNAHMLLKKLVEAAYGPSTTT